MTSLNQTTPGVMYVGGTLPTRSETFVYRELFALRERGVRIIPASVHEPEGNLGESRLDELAKESIRIYSAGPARLVIDALLEIASHPADSFFTLSRILTDAAFSPEAPVARKPKILWQGLAGLALARRARPRAVAHIHAHMAHVQTTIAMYAARQLGVRFSFTGHANDLFPNRTLLREKLARAAFVACISRWHREFYQSVVRRDPADLPLVRCGVDIPPARSMERPGADPSNLTMLAVGRLVPKKGFDVLLDALALLRDKLGGVRVLIAGDGPEAERLKDQVDRLGLGSVVALLGAQNNTRVLELMREADIFVLPCRVDNSGDRDGIPVVLMEAMAAGACAVSGDLPAIRELVEHDATGILVPPGDAPALARALGVLLGDRGRLARLARAGRDHVAREFSLSANADVIRSSLARVVGLAAPEGEPQSAPMVSSAAMADETQGVTTARSRRATSA